MYILKFFSYFIIFNLGPGTKPPEVRTMEYLEEVAVKIAQDLANKKMKVDRTRSLFESMLDFFPPHLLIF